MCVLYTQILETVLRIQKATWCFQGYQKINYISLSTIRIIFYIQTQTLYLSSRLKFPCVFRTNLLGLPNSLYSHQTGLFHTHYVQKYTYPKLLHEGLVSVNSITIVLPPGENVTSYLTPSSALLPPQPLVNECLWLIFPKCLLYLSSPMFYSYCHYPCLSIHRFPLNHLDNVLTVLTDCLTFPNIFSIFLMEESSKQ